MTDLDPEDAPVELDEEGFLVSGGRRRQFPTNLDVWVRWSGAVVVGVSAFGTLAYLIAATLMGWVTGPSDLPLPRPDGYFSLLLLAGVLLLVLRRRFGSGTASAGWARGAACLGAGTGGALVVSQLAGNIGAIVHPLGEGYSQPAAYIAGGIIGGIGGLADAVFAGFAAVLAVLLYRWSRAPAGPAIEDGQESEPEGVIEESGTSTDPDREPRGSVGPVVASLLLGAVVAVACLYAFDLGIRSQPKAGTGRLPTSGTPVVSIPSPASTIASLPFIYECSTPSAGGGTFCRYIFEPASPSPSS
jgi:hypothetical protein